MNNYHILKLLNVFLLFILFIFWQCTKEDISPNETEYDFAIYMLENSELKIADIITKELSEQNSQALATIKLQQNPWLTIDDFNFYDFSSHIIYLKQNNSALFPKPVEGLYPDSWWDKPFMVVANGQRRYVGIFRGALSSEKQWPFPYIEDFIDSISYGSVTPILVEAIKEKQEIIESQQSKIDKLEKLVNKLINNMEQE